MLSFAPGIRIYMAVHPVDMRKSFDGLSAAVEAVFDRNVLDGHLFLFLNKRRDRIKTLWWDGDGLAIFAKRLELGCFSRPRSESAGTDRSVRLTPAELGLLLEGIEVLQARRSRRYRRAKDRAEAGRGEAL